MTLDDTLAAARSVALPRQEILDHGRADLIELTHADILLHARIVRRRRRRRAIVGVSFVAATVGAFLVIPRDDGPRPPSAAAPPAPASPPAVVEVAYTNASQVLAATATAAGSQAAPDSPYWKVVTQQGADASTRRSVWAGVDGPGVTEMGIVGGLTEHMFTAIPQSTVRLGKRTYTWRELNDGALSAPQLARLLTENELAHDDPTKTDRAAHESYFFKEAYELLARTPASPAVRQKLWDAVADIDGVELDGKVTDSLGRAGWAVSLTLVGQGSQTYIVDPANGALLESRGHAEGVSPADGWVETLVEAGPADSAPQPTPKQEIRRRMEAAEPVR